MLNLKNLHYALRQQCTTTAICCGCVVILYEMMVGTTSLERGEQYFHPFVCWSFCLSEGCVSVYAFVFHVSCHCTWLWSSASPSTYQVSAEQSRISRFVFIIKLKYEDILVRRGGSSSFSCFTKRGCVCENVYVCGCIIPWGHNEKHAAVSAASCKNGRPRRGEVQKQSFTQRTAAIVRGECWHMAPLYYLFHRSWRENIFAYT